jgi:sulfur carrier protein ThiS
MLWTFLFPSWALTQDNLSEDLQAVPAEALGFLHIRAADVWKSDYFKDVRDILSKTGQDVLDAYAKRFTPYLGDLDRVTLFINTEMQVLGRVVIVLHFNKELNKEKILKDTFPSAELRKGKSEGWYLEEKTGMSFRFIGKNSIALGESKDIQIMTEQAKTGKPHGLAQALSLANTGKHHAVLAVNLNTLPKDEWERQIVGEFPAEIRPLFGMKNFLVTLDLNGNGIIRVEATYPDLKSTEAAEKAAIAGKDSLTKIIDEQRIALKKTISGDGKPGTWIELPNATLSLLALGGINRIDEMLKKEMVKRNDKTLSFTQELPSELKTLVGPLTLAGLGLALPEVEKVQIAAGRIRGSNNLKQIGLALHNYHDSFGKLPPAAIVDKKGKPLLSWRVMILPFIEQEKLYHEFKLDEPWDSEHNKKLIAKMPKVYQHHAVAPKEGHTHYRVFVGNGAAWDWNKGYSLVNFADGTSNTFMVIEAQESVIWTKPDELEYDPKKDVNSLGTHTDGGFLALMGDGSVQFFSPKLSQRNRHAFITQAGGEIIEIEKRK